MRHLNVRAKPGLNRVAWFLDDDSNAPVAEGEYQVTLHAGEKMMSQVASVATRAPADSPRPNRFRRENSEDQEP